MNSIEFPDNLLLTAILIGSFLLIGVSLYVITASQVKKEQKTHKSKDYSKEDVRYDRIFESQSNDG